MWRRLFGGFRRALFNGYEAAMAPRPLATPTRTLLQPVSYLSTRNNPPFFSFLGVGWLLGTGGTARVWLAEHTRIAARADNLADCLEGVG